MNLISIAQAADGSAASSSIQAQLMGMAPILGVFLILWLVMIRPQMKKAKDQQKMIGALAKGDEVVTTGGLVGRISKLGDNFLHLEIADKVEVQVQRGAVSTLLPKGSLKLGN
jgi:preprotein translocase subunit YajC